LPVNLLDDGGVKSLINRGGIFSLLAILDDFGHAFLIERTFKKDRFNALDQLDKGFLETIRGKMGCSYKKGNAPVLLDPPYGL
jgi:hypothetical protein